MEDSSDRLKSVELDILKEFIRICQENQLQYYLVGGSALGAIRHHGFIPWDDDIDVALPRKDYNSFLEIGQKNLPDYYFLQTFETDPEYPVNFAKIRDSRTTFIESSMKNRKMNHGIYIDVFPLDFYPEHNVGWFKLIDLLQKARISIEFSSVASTKMRAVQAISKVLYPDLTKTLKRREQHLQSISSSSMVTNFLGAWRDKETMPKKVFKGGTLVTFENIKALVPEDYDTYLTHLYGDYMTPPPVEKQKGHHYTEIIDFDKPFTEYI